MRKDVVAERRYAAYTCDECRKHEGHFYDQSGLVFSDITWDADWQQIWFTGDRNAEPSAFCSAGCLAAYLDRVIGAVYPATDPPTAITEARA